ncbi:hypothetical protein [Streptomyces sp. VRA16 Mangrove soil]|uniref:hypothetical protein n=1 Tax=Streptomyces sp. VRA16 Mangrove soil TaxID=2817434 RepID=UPI001A9D32CA|nr:hypothetical protein [Streptomyces sp. VRA16 Mangrove soil]MBO1337549.1 hypothetical protein [Streptomyces sp. VRA16 Mangrove soil]
MSWGDVRTVENWREDALPGQTHDPHEVTVQLDGAGRLLGEMIAAGKLPGEAGAGPDPGGDKEVPVFVDDSGRRSRTFRRFGVAVGLACAVYAVVIVATLLSGNSSAPWLPGLSEDQKSADTVDTQTELPADSASPTTSTGATPDPSASGTASGAAASPGASTSPSAGATDDQGKPTSGATGSGRPTGGTTTKPADPTTPAGGTTTKPADPTTPADPDPTTTPPVDPPPEGTTSGGGGTDTVADGTSAHLPDGQGTGAEPSASSVAS